MIPALEPWVEALRNDRLARAPRLACDAQAPPEGWALATARYLYQRWLRERPWGPLVHLAPRHAHRRHLAAALRQAEEGALYLEAGWEGWAEEAELRSAADDHQVALILRGDEPLSLTPEDGDRLRAYSASHVVAADPELEQARATLIDRCRAGEVICLIGADSEEGPSLARWAHANRGERERELALDVVTPDEPKHPRRGHWQLYANADALDDQQFAPMAEHLRRRVFERPVTPPAPLPEQHTIAGITGDDPAFLQVLHRASEIAPKAHSVVIRGERGAGKTGLARLLHEFSGRKGAFVEFDLGTLSGTMSASQLFGVAANAATGVAASPGLFRKADRGTLFLDELSSLSSAPHAQQMFLGVLQSRTVRPVGSPRDAPVDVMVVTATNADMEALLDAGAFQRDLYDRLNAHELWLPPLRERRGDIRRLALRLLNAYGGEARGFDREAAEALETYDWPGNVRELESVVRDAASRAQGPQITLDDLSVKVTAWRPTPTILTSTQPPSTWGGLERAARARLAPMQLALPPMTQRSEISIRSAIFAHLGGHPIEDAALEALEAHPWWDGPSAIRDAITKLCAGVSGALTSSTIRERAPELLLDDVREDIELLMFPCPKTDRHGRPALGGWRRAFSEPAVLGGRAWSPQELAADSRRPAIFSIGQRWGFSLHKGLAFCPFRESGLLSKAHFLLVRASDGLRLHNLQGAARSIQARSLDSPRFDTLLPSHDLSLGLAAEIYITSKSQGALRLFAFTGGVRPDDFAEVVLAANAGQQITHAQTTHMGDQRPRQEPPAPFRKGRRRVWTLDADERQIVVRIIQRYRGDSMRAHLVREVALLPEQYEHLRWYIDSSHPSLYFKRLCTHPNNARLWDDLDDALGGLPDPGWPPWLSGPKGLLQRARQSKAQVDGS